MLPPRLRSCVLWPVLVGSAALVPGGIALALLAAWAQRAGSSVAATQPLIVTGSVLLTTGIAAIDLAGGLLVVGTPRLGWWRWLGAVGLLAAVAWWALLVIAPPPFWALLWNLPPAAAAWIGLSTAALLVGGVVAHVVDAGDR